MTKPTLLVLAVTLLSFACSHKAPKKDANAVTVQPTPTKSTISSSRPSAIVATASATPADEGLSIPMCNGTACAGSGADEYLNTVALPKIVNARIAHECFLDSPRAKAKEKATGSLSYRFEIKLVAQKDHVGAKEVYLSSFSNVPVWAINCFKNQYLHMTFPPFTDKSLKTTTAFGTANITWDQKETN